MNYVECSTNCGVLRGIETEKCLEYRGIRYATAERFAYPKQVTGWDGVYDATQFRECSYQHRAFDNDATVNAFYHNEFRKGLSFTYSEDCLYLNIYAPKKAENCSVLIYIHGGSFTGGSADEGHISGVRFAENGIIMVAINYRLGPFGFCSHPDIKGENGACGNQGLFDQVEAIKWVKRNIAAFGGDPDKITLMGQSAGAMSVDIHISNPLVKNQFNGAIMMSGGGLQRFLAKPMLPEKTVPFWDAIMANAKVSSMAELKQIEPRNLYYAWLDACKAMKLSMLYTLPVYDGVLLRKGEFNTNTIADMPYILGVTSTDMMPIVLQHISKKWGKYAQRKNKNKCYIYNFTRDLPGDEKGAWHSSDLLYAFSTLDFNWRPFEEIDYTISNQLSNAICAFAKNGSPDCDVMPEWKPDYRKPMHFCENTGIAKWDTFKNLHSTFSYKGMG